MEEVIIGKKHDRSRDATYLKGIMIWE
jgi:hypothetical protein